MEQSARSKGSAGANRFSSLTKQMALEAADMEARLASLRAAMAKEKTKREAALGGAGAAGSIWSHGGAGSLKPKGAQLPQEPTAARAVARSSSGGGSRSSNAISPSAGTHAPKPAPVPAAATSRPVARAPSISRPGSQPGSSHVQPGTGTNAVRAGLHPTGSFGSGTARAPAQQLVSEAAAVSGSKTGSRGTAGDAPAASATSSSSRAATSSRPDSRSSDGEGMACGTDDGLLAGAYDEAASRNSFLEALNEWRRAGTSNHSSNGATSSSSGAGTNAVRGSSQPGKAPTVSAMDVQTDQPGLLARANNDSTNQSLLKNSSGNTGSSVGGSYFLKMLARGSSRQAVDDSSAAAGSGSDRQQQDQQPADVGSAATDDTITIGNRQKLQHSEDEQLVVDEADYSAAPGEDSTSDAALLGFDAWLQAAEQHAERAISTHLTDAGQANTSLPSAYMQPRTGDGQQLDVAEYEQQLQHILDKLDRLEPSQPADAGLGKRRVVASVQPGSSVVYFTSGTRLPDSVRLPAD